MDTAQIGTAANTSVASSLRTRDGGEVLSRSTTVEAPVAPALSTLLPAAAHALELELGTSPGEVTVVAASRRSYSSVWELHTASGDYILKWLPRRAERERELTRLCARVFAGTPLIRTPRVACCPTADTFLVERLPGVSLQAACTAPPLWRLSHWVAARQVLLTRVGTWLNAFHRCAMIPQSAPLSAIKAYVLNREPVFRAVEKELLDELLRLLDTTVAPSTTRIHGDFTPHNILVAGDTVAVIDLAGISEFEWATPCFDAAAMVVGLEEAWRARSKNHLRYYSAPVRQMIAGFLRGAGVSTDEPAFPVCYAVRHFIRIGNLFRQTGKPPGPRSWHVRRLRLALEQPDALRRFTAGLSEA